MCFENAHCWAAVGCHRENALPKRVTKKEIACTLHGKAIRKLLCNSVTPLEVAELTSSIVSTFHCAGGSVGSAAISTRTYPPVPVPISLLYIEAPGKYAPRYNILFSCKYQLNFDAAKRCIIRHTGKEKCEHRRNTPSNSRAVAGRSLRT